MPVRGRPRRAPCAPRPERLRVEPLADRLAPSANPTAVDDTYSTKSGTTLVVAPAGVLANDLSPTGLAVTAVLTKATQNGALNLNADGSFAYTPDPAFIGTDEFRYKAVTADGDSNNAHVFILVGVAAVTPTAVDDGYATPEDQSLTVPVADGVLANDINPNASTLTAALQTGPAHGTTALNPDGSFTYTPAADFNGTDSFAYLVTDGGGTSAVGTATIVVTPVNDPPAAVADQYATPEDKPLAGGSVLANDADPDGDPLTAVLVAGPAHGSLTLNADGTFRYVPAAGYFGADSFTYVARDPLGAESAPATATITVARVNHRPAADADRYTTTQDTALKVPAAGVLANDTDRDGDRLTAVLVSGPAHGTLILRANGSFVYVPDPGFSGTDRFTYRASDGSQSSKAVRVTIRVVAAPPQPPPQPPPVPTPTGGGPGPTTGGSGATPTSPIPVAAGPILFVPPSLTNPPTAFGSNGLPGNGATVPASPAKLPPAVPTPSVVVPSLPPPPPVPFVPPVSVEASPPPVVVPVPPAAPAIPVVPPVPQLQPDNPVFGGLEELSHDVGQAKGIPKVTGTVVGTGVVATAGYVLLSPRLAYWLLSALLARRTVWKPFDPLEVVYAWEREKGLGGDDDDSLDKMVDSDTAEPKT